MRPDRTEATDYWFWYIDQVPDGGMTSIMRSQKDFT